MDVALVAEVVVDSISVDLVEATLVEAVPAEIFAPQVGGPAPPETSIWPSTPTADSISRLALEYATAPAAGESALPVPPR